MADETYDSGTLKKRKNQLQRSGSFLPADTSANAPLTQGGGMTARESKLAEDYRLKRGILEGQRRLRDATQSHIADMAGHTVSETQALRMDVRDVLSRPMSPTERGDVRDDASDIYEIAVSAMKEGLKQSAAQMNKIASGDLTPADVPDKAVYGERRLKPIERLSGHIIEKK